MSHLNGLRRVRRLGVFALTLLAIEFLDEFIFGGGEAAWPLIRSDLLLTYAEIGVLLSLPRFIGNLIEPVIGILGDVWRRRTLMVIGGVGFVVSVLLSALSHSFWPLLASFILFSPSSGAFVGLSQSTLMDTDPTRHEQNMARWTFAGSAGIVIGALALSGLLAIGLGWRAHYLISAVLGIGLCALLFKRFPRQVPVQAADSDGGHLTFGQGVRNALAALRRFEVLRWLTLLQFSDLMLDILHSYLALYMVDVAGMAPEAGGLAVAVWTGVGLISDFLLIPLLEYMPGLRYLRLSALIELLLFPAFLLVPGLVPKLILLGLLGFFNAGWYAILQGQLYSAMPGQSATVMTVGSVFGLLGSFIPLSLGLVAERFGLGSALWLCLLGPIAFLVGLPRGERRQAIVDDNAPLDAL